MPDANPTAHPIPSGGIDSDDLQQGWRVEVKDRTAVNPDGTHLVVEVFAGDGHMTLADAHTTLIELTHERPQLHHAGSPQFLTLVPATRGGTR